MLNPFQNLTFFSILSQNMKTIKFQFYEIIQKIQYNFFEFSTNFHFFFKKIETHSITKKRVYNVLGHVFNDI